MALKVFQSAMRFFAVRTFESLRANERKPKVFQSAMRIFCCSNKGLRAANVEELLVSIRDADFLLFEQCNRAH